MRKPAALPEKTKKRLAGAAIAVFLLFSGLVCWLIGVPMLRFVQQPELFRAWVDARGVWGRAAYVGMVVLQVFVAVIPGEPLEIGGGYAFGALEGTLLCLLGEGIGSLAVFFFIRRFGLPAVEVFFPAEKLEKLRFLQTSPKRNALFFLIFMVPGTPKDILCYFAGLTDMKLSAWLLICTLGRIPSVLTSTLGGAALGLKNYQFAVIVFGATLLLSGAGFLLYQKICKEQDKHGNSGKHEAHKLDSAGDAERVLPVSVSVSDHSVSHSGKEASSGQTS
jgi:uncharacterized membrane protein YdjX (TVP38/TMEM64 family)